MLLFTSYCVDEIPPCAREGSRAEWEIWSLQKLNVSLDVQLLGSPVARFQKKKNGLTYLVTILSTFVCQNCRLYHCKSACAARVPVCNLMSSEENRELADLHPVSMHRGSLPPARRAPVDVGLRGDRLSGARVARGGARVVRARRGPPVATQGERQHWIVHIG